MPKYVYNWMNRYVHKYKDLGELKKAVLRDVHAKKELQEQCNVTGDSAIEKEIELALDAYPDLKSKYGI